MSHTSPHQHHTTLEQAYASITAHPGSTPSHKAKTKSLSHPRSSSKARGGDGGPSSAPSADASTATSRKFSGPGPPPPSPYSASLARYPSNSCAAGHAAHPVRTPSSSSCYNSNAMPSNGSANSPVHVRHGKLPGQIWMPEGVVDMASFGPILAMDDHDPSREFSKALVWAWCDQAEMAIEEMDHYLNAGDIEKLADKAHYLKGSSASLGLVKVSNTCAALYHVHFPPSLAHLRTFSYTGGGISGLSSGSHSSSPYSACTSSSSSASSATPSTPYLSDDSSSSSSSGQSHLTSSPRQSPSATLKEFPFHMPTSTGASRVSPDLAPPYSHENWGTMVGTGDSASSSRSERKGVDAAELFHQQKITRAHVMLERLKTEVKSSSEWLYAYYCESDKYAGVPTDGS